MAELLVRVVDKVGADLYQDCALTKRGDVISVCPDGWKWGKEELTAPYWRIIKLPNVSVGVAETFLATELPIDENDKRRTLLRRWFYLDIGRQTMPTRFRNWLADDSRKDPFLVLDFTEAQILNLKVQKARIADPAISEVIG